jgi:anti-sigma factor RsiW
MCPDKQFLSIYYDGELPKAWEKKMERHLESCPECGEYLNVYRNISGALNDGMVLDGERYTAVMEAARNRIWQELDGNSIDHKFVQPRLTLHIPTAFAAVAAGVAAAAAVIIVTLLVSPKQNDGFASANASDDGFTNVAVSSDHEFPEIAPVENMQELLSYLENNDSSNIVIIKLPERKKFKRYGEPALINAADYTRARPQK